MRKLAFLKTIQKIGLLFVLFLVFALLPSKSAGAVTGYQWIEAVPYDILVEKFAANDDELTAADEYFEDGVDGAYYYMVGYNCSDDETIGDFDSPDCEQYYYYAASLGNEDPSPTFQNVCRLVDSCGAGSDDSLYVSSAESACRTEPLAPTGGNLVCSSAITINDPSSLASTLQEGGIDFSGVQEWVIEEEEDAPFDEDPGGESTSDEEVSGEPCYDGDGGEGVFGIVTGIAGGGMQWITCEVSQWVGTAIDGLNEIIRDLLEFNPTSSEIDDSENTLQIAWGNLLRFANILFVIAFLVMIISTALDLGIFTNYTIKKLLPRIILAALLANLSWGIITVLIDITNAVGGATNAIILSPLGNIDNIANSGTPQALQEAATKSEGSGLLQTGIVTGLGTLIYFTIASAGAILLPVIATAFIAVLIAFGALLLRRIIIVLLIILAPLAFAMWALPGGEKLFQRWWKLFIQMLIMYPMILALFAAGIFVSQLLLSTSGQAGLGALTSVAAFAAIILPYLLIPTLFKLAGGFLGNITGMINDRGKGLIDRSRKWRDEGSQYGRRKQLKAQRKNFTGHEKLLHSMDAEKLAGSKFLQGRRRAMGLGRAWGQGDLAEQTQRTFLAKTKAAVSKENLDAASYTLRAAGGGIDARRRDGAAKQFKVTRAGETTSMMLDKDAAVAEGLMGARVESLEEKYDATGKFAGYDENKVNGVLGDGSEASQRAFGGLAGVQGLAPVIEASRFGTTDKNTGVNWAKWSRYDTKGNKLKDATGAEVLHEMSGFGDTYQAAYAAGNTAAASAASTAGGVITETKDSYAGNFKDKLPSWITGENLAFTGFNSNKIASMHENDMQRGFRFIRNHDNGQAALSALGQGMIEVYHDPAKFGGRSPKTMQVIHSQYQDLKGSTKASDQALYASLTPEMITAFEAIRPDGTLK